MVEVVAAYIKKDGKFLACQRPVYKKRGLLWEFVGGKVEKGESKEDALIRECREELCAVVKPLSVFFETVHEYPDMCVKLTVFNAELVSDKLVMAEHNDIRWISKDEIKDYCFCPADNDILEKIKNEQ